MTDHAMHMAVDEFRRVEQAELLLDKRKRALMIHVVNMDEGSRAEYVRLTNEIQHEFETKREKELG